MKNITLVLSSTDCLLKSKEKAEYLIPLPGKILPPSASGWSVCVTSLSVYGFHTDLVARNHVVLLLLSKTLAENQPVGPRYLPVLAVLHYIVSDGSYTYQSTISDNQSYPKPIADLCGASKSAETVDLAITYLDGTPLESKYLADLDTALCCTIQLTFKEWQECS